jgi:alpha-beta hydrolase superfamily lysophospholipase
MKGILKVVAQYKRNGLNNIETLFFKDGRHEMLNERNKMQVYSSIYNWLMKQLGE